MKLFYVCAQAEDIPGSDTDDADLLVRADDVEQAVGFWRQHYQLPDSVNPYWIGEVPEGTTAGPVKWEDIKANSRAWRL